MPGRTRVNPSRPARTRRRLVPFKFAPARAVLEVDLLEIVRNQLDGFGIGVVLELCLDEGLYEPDVPDVKLTRWRRTTVMRLLPELSMSSNVA